MMTTHCKIDPPRAGSDLKKNGQTFSVEERFGKQKQSIKDMACCLMCNN